MMILSAVSISKMDGYSDVTHTFSLQGGRPFPTAAVAGHASPRLGRRPPAGPQLLRGSCAPRLIMAGPGGLAPISTHSKSKGPPNARVSHGIGRRLSWGFMAAPLVIPSDSASLHTLPTLIQEGSESAPCSPTARALLGTQLWY